MPADHNSAMSVGRRAALEVLGILPRPGATSPAPEAGGAPQRAAPVASETINWDEIVASENARRGLQAPAGAPPVATAERHHHPDQRSAVIDWTSVVHAVNAEAGFDHGGANVDPRFAAYLTTGVA